MADLAALFASAFRDRVTPGVADSPINRPAKPELRALGSAIASEILSRYQAPVTGVQSRTDATPPGSPSAGQRWIVPAGATGSWSGQAGKVAEWLGSAWAFTAPNAVFSAYVLDEAQLYGYDGTAWKILTGASLGFPTVAAMALVTTAAANIRAIVESDIVARTAYRGRSSNIATIVTETPHGLTPGAKVNIRNLGASSYNADQVAVTVVDYATFTYANSGGNESATADTAGQVDRNGTYVSNGAGGWTWNGDPLLDPAIAAQLGKAETIVADISSLATLTQYVTTTGALSATDANWRSSPMLQAAPGEVYVFSGLGNTGVSSVTFYDASSVALETHVSASNSAVYSGSFTAPASTAFVRFCYGTLGAVPSSFRGSISGAPLYLATRGQAVELIGHATGSGYLGTTGVLASSDTNWINSGFLPVAPDDTIIFTLYGNSAVGNICFYDADKQFISAKIGSSVAPLADVVDGSIRAPAGSAYLRIATASAAFQPTLAQTVKLLTTAAAIWEALRALADRVDSGQSVELIDYATNVGYFGPTGVFTSDGNWVCTSLLPAEAGDAITFKLWGHALVGSICFFDATGTFLSSVVGGVVGSLLAYLFEGVAVAPVDTAYVRISTASATFHPTPTQSARLPVTVGRVWGEVNATANAKFALAPFKAPRQLQLQATDRILLYGDSISSTDYAGYASAMADLTGVSVYAGGFSGYTTAQLAANAQLQRIWDYGARLVVVLIGGNDTGAAGTVGTFGAISGESIVPETDIGADYAGSTLIQAISHIIRKFKARYDNIRVRANLTGSETEAERDAKIAPLLKPVLIFATALPQKRVDSASAYSQAENWERKRRAVIECCDRYEVHCVDLMRATSLDMSVEPYWTAPTDTLNNRGVWFMDGLHPNKYLFRKMAEIIGADMGIATNVDLAFLSPATFAMDQLAAENRVYQRQTASGGGGGLGFGQMAVGASVSVPGQIWARCRSAADGSTILQAPWRAALTRVTGAQTLNIQGVDARLGWFYLDLSGDGTTWQLGTKKIGMGRVVGVAGQSLAVRMLGRVADTATNASLGVSISSNSSVYATYEDLSRTVTTPAWAQPDDASNYDSTFAAEFLRREVAASGVNCALVGHAVGGSWIETWVPSAVANNVAPLRAVLDAVGGFEAFIWFQGHTDAGNGMLFSFYQGYLAEVIADLQAHNVVRGSQFQILLCAIPNIDSPWWGNELQRDVIRQAQLEYAKTHGAIYSQPMNIDLIDGVHQSQAGSVTLGQRFSAALHGTTYSLPALTGTGLAYATASPTAFGQARMDGYGLTASANDNLPPGATWTMEARFSTSTTPASVKVICGQGQKGWIGLAPDGRLIANYTVSGGGDAYVNGTGPTGGGSNPTITDGAMHHVALVVTQNQTKLYLDGALIGAETSEASGIAGDTPFCVGSLNGSSGNIFPGVIDEVAIWFDDHYTTTFTPRTVPLVGTELGLGMVWHLDGNLNCVAPG
ncbi:lysophospholipase L1-like esterase [Methylosinus sp. sav-2]|uniref:DUF2793 domain-containing protein n=1 Tax=Methylosinus sp. sav-2 TaxID=2485168 RepID=UPI000690A8E1|nr:DUF2793 domain-containing protein [Methylosinus sp. sav-2]TDX61917.1 lysophospholipase L1-like esterase [Methylosinus sp. sav-2]